MREMLILLFLLPICLLSQEAYRQYDTQRYYHEYLPKTGNGSETLGEHGRDFEQRIIEEKIRKRSEQTDIVKNRYIGLIFHVISDESNAEIRSKIAHQLNALNKAFNEKPNAVKSNFDPQGQFIQQSVNPRLRFYAAEIDDIEGGIRQVSKGSRSWQDFDEMKDDRKGGLRSIDAAQYINIWITSLPEGMYSYATSAYVRNEQSGIVLDESLLPNNDRRGDYSEGKSLVHLIGNYLGLRDLWDDYEECSDDYVADTPIHNMANRGRPRYNHVTTCVRDRLVPEMVINYMDNTADDIQTMFTAGQVQRMHAVIEITLAEMNINDSKTKDHAQ